MLRDLIHRSYPDLTEAEYKEHVDAWLALDSETESERYYREQVLPRSCARVRACAPEEPCELLIVPVGTQPFAPIMACLGMPARRIVLLHSGESRHYAEQVVEALGISDGPAFYKVLISEWDPHDIMNKVHSVYDVLGQSPPQQVYCDVTGGTKVMTATLAGIAAVNGWSQVYVKSEYKRKGSFNEEIISVPAVFQQMGGWQRGIAHKLAAAGHFDQAAAALQSAMRDSIATARDALQLKRYRLAHAYRQGDQKTLSRQLPALARALSVPLPTSTLEVLRDGAIEGLVWEAATALRAAGQRYAALGLLSEFGLRSSVDSLTSDLRRWKELNGEAWQLRAWRPVDRLVGERYRREIAVGQG